MAFRFSLQSVLRFRQGVERQRLLLLQAANLRVAALRSQLEALDRAQAGIRSSSARDLSAGVNAAQLHFNEVCRSALSQRQKKLQEELLRGEEECMCRGQEFQQARQQREVLDILREQHLARYRGQQDRRDQRQLDDTLLLHRAFLRRG